MRKGPLTPLLDSRGAHVYSRLRSGSFICIFLVLFAAASAFMPLAVSRAQTKISRFRGAAVDLGRTPKYKPNTVLVRFRPGAQRSAMEVAHQQSGAKIVSEPAIVNGLHIVQLATGVSLESALKSLILTALGSNLLVALHSRHLPVTELFTTMGVVFSILKGH